ncbi:cupin domain-containing protein [Paenibacillus pasadenensis]|uniref:cupin domain-containing protein n=1 Tax=Paenibacillus pasadenensis TaxID=217090 RepID=UPI002040C2DE|nr:cupin domain-containing protein [Paenibacillus pasadenensis]MCM3749452.1 cupin domain-containing protein [Paenibacillus pasadenensis]
MTTSYMDYTAPNLSFSYDMRNNTAFKTNDQNYINLLGYKQLPTLGSASLLDIFMSKGHYVEPHYHQNASELVYLISGSATVSMINPFTNQLISIAITPQQVVIVPQGWWHYEEATSDNTHILAVFDAPTPQVILGSDLLRLTPANVMAKTYCLDEAKYKEAISPIKQPVGIGPLDNCKQHRAADEEGSAEEGDWPAAAGAISAYDTAPPWAGTSASAVPAFVYGQSPFRTQPPGYYSQPFSPQPPYGYAPVQGYAQPYASAPAVYGQAQQAGYAQPSYYATYAQQQSYPQQGQGAFAGPFAAQSAEGTGAYR